MTREDQLEAALRAALPYVENAYEEVKNFDSDQTVEVRRDLAEVYAALGSRNE